MKGQFAEQGVAIVVISFAQPARLIYYQQMQKWPFTLLADPDRKAYNYFGLRRLPWYRVFSVSTLKLYWKLLGEGRKFQNYGKDDYFQAGGDFLLDDAGKIFFAHHSHDPSDRPAAARLLEEVRRTKKQKRAETMHIPG